MAFAAGQGSASGSDQFYYCTAGDVYEGRSYSYFSPIFRLAKVPTRLEMENAFRIRIEASHEIGMLFSSTCFGPLSLQEAEHERGRTMSNARRMRGEVSVIRWKFIG